MTKRLIDSNYKELTEEERKKEYKARLKAQKEEMMNKLLNSEQRKLYEDFLEKDHELYMEWEDRVMGRVKKNKE